jgi:hypothetical protein
LNRSTALWASRASSKVALHSAVSRLLVTTVEKRASLYLYCMCFMC